jgi:SAM-dependent methyltransferase
VSLLDADAVASSVLDAGCGTGFVARELAPRVDRVDAVDFSEAAIETGRSLPGGDHRNLRWISGPVETAPLDPPYALVTAGASLHWFEWEVALPRFREVLTSGGCLATVEEVDLPNPWDADARRIQVPYSMNREFTPYTMATIAAELESRGLFRTIDARTTEPTPFRQPVAEWVESFHARNGFSRDRMDPAHARECDEQLTEMMRTYCPDGIVEQRVAARVIWGRPGA